MEFCAIISEFNPFHNGHKYLLKQIKARSGCDKIICIMSGEFTQRGEIAVADKYTRAKHAVLGGADCVLELPVSFSVAPAEIFAKGALKILKSIPAVTALAFGCENTADFNEEAKILLNETKKFTSILGKNLDEGQSYIKSYAEAFIAVGGNGSLVSNPNNVLALEYAKANLRDGRMLELLPVKRIGASYNDGELKENFSSASAIRKNLSAPSVKDNVPDFVFKDLNLFGDYKEKFAVLTLFALLSEDGNNIRRVFGCGEGLENRLREKVAEGYDAVIAHCTSKRYASSRIKRILCANLLKLYADECNEFLNSPLYLKPLAVKKDCADEILAELARSEYPVIVRGRDCEKLGETAEKCLQKDEYSARIREFIACGKTENKILLI